MKATLIPNPSGGMFTTSGPSGGNKASRISFELVVWKGINPSLFRVFRASFVHNNLSPIYLSISISEPGLGCDDDDDPESGELRPVDCDTGGSEAAKWKALSPLWFNADLSRRGHSGQTLQKNIRDETFFNSIVWSVEYRTFFQFKSTGTVSVSSACLFEFLNCSRIQIQSCKNFRLILARS